MAKRRGHGEGSIHQREDGRWVAVVDQGYKDGKRQRKYLYAETRKEVAEKLTAALRDHQQGLPLPSERLTVGQYLQDWLTTQQQQLRPASMLRYQSILTHHVLPSPLARAKLAQLQPHQVAAFLASLALAPATVRVVRSVLVAALQDAMRQGMVARNVAALTEGPRLERAPVSALTLDEVQRVLAAAQQGPDWVRPLLLAALATGGRLGELAGLSWPDLDLATGLLGITRQRTPTGVLAPPKSRARTVELAPVALETLRDYRRHQMAEHLRVGIPWDASGPIFERVPGRPLIHATVEYQWQRTLDRAGLSRRPFHHLRHASASWLLLAGLDIKLVQHLLGHSDIGTTADTYAHLMPQLLREAATRVDALLRGAMGGAAR
ncbi:MAG: site-specific integrase [Chloroflexi bacterium]|nr:site-specific integrase [Chloroflexota bacterium]